MVDIGIGATWRPEEDFLTPCRFFLAPEYFQYRPQIQCFLIFIPTETERKYVADLEGNSIFRQYTAVSIPLPCLYDQLVRLKGIEWENRQTRRDKVVDF